MTIQINRRTFLQALIAAGASYALPAKATQVQVDKVWAEAQTNPWYFEVNDYGTLVDTDVSEPQVWADVFDITVNEHSTPESLIREIESCSPLCTHMSEALDKEIESLEEDLDEDAPTNSKEQKALLRKINALKDARDEYEEPWQEWIELEGKNGIAKFNALIEDWLSDPIDWMQSDFFPVRSGPQGAALGFFQDQPYELLDALGVVVIEGEHPGSSYYAAELRQDIAKANAVAVDLGLPFRFKTETVSEPEWQPSKLAIAINGPDDLQELRRIDSVISGITEEKRHASLPSELSEIVNRFTSTLPHPTSYSAGMARGMKTMKLRGHVRGFVKVCGRVPDENEIKRLWDVT